MTTKPARSSTRLQLLKLGVALQAVKHPANAFHGSYRQMVERGKAKMVASGALMHKILRVACGVPKHQTPFTEDLAKQFSSCA